MKKSTKIWIGIGAATAVGLAIIAFKISKPKLAPEDMQPDNSGGTSENTTQPTRPPSVQETVNLGRGETGKIGFPLKIGDKGVGISYLQKALQCLGFYSGAIDGKFGAETYKALNDHSYLYRLSCRWRYNCIVNEEDWKKIIKEARQKCGTNIFFVPDEVWEQYNDTHTSYWSKKRQEI
jgi:hypothetical protein